MESDEALDDSFSEDSFTELEAVISKVSTNADIAMYSSYLTIVATISPKLLSCYKMLNHFDFVCVNENGFVFGNGGITHGTHL